jgi:hypothetical protein
MIPQKYQTEMIVAEFKKWNYKQEVFLMLCR